MPSITAIKQTWDVYTSPEMQAYLSSPKFKEDAALPEQTCFDISDEASRQVYLRAEFRRWIKTWSQIAGFAANSSLYAPFLSFVLRIRRDGTVQARQFMEETLATEVNNLFDQSLCLFEGQKVSVHVFVDGNVMVTVGHGKPEQISKQIKADFVETIQEVEWKGKPVVVWGDEDGKNKGLAVNAKATLLLAPLPLSPVVGDIVFQVTL